MLMYLGLVYELYLKNYDCLFILYIRKYKTFQNDTYFDKKCFQGQLRKISVCSEHSPPQQVSSTSHEMLSFNATVYGSAVPS